jgi:hypothetical protein
LTGDYDVGGTCTLSLSLDGTVSSFQSPSVQVHQPQQIIWSSNRLDDGAHTLEGTIGSCTGSGTPLSIDYLLYTPSASANSTDGLTLFIDDNDSVLNYSGTWTAGGEDGNFQRTVHGGESGASVSLQFSGM